MKAKTVDARGLSCPLPVVYTQKAIKEGLTAFDIVINSEVCKENVLRFLERYDFKVTVKEDGDDIIISVSK